MHGDDLPDLLSVISIALTLVVILYARGTIIEARRTTAEERNTVTALQDVISAMTELAASSAGTLEAARQTADLTGSAGQRDQIRQSIEALRSMAGTVEEIRLKAAEACRSPSGAVPESKWRCAEQVALAFQMSGLPKALPSCTRLYRMSGALEIHQACPDATTEIKGGLAALRSGI